MVDNADRRNELRSLLDEKETCLKACREASNASADFHKTLKDEMSDLERQQSILLCQAFIRCEKKYLSIQEVVSDWFREYAPLDRFSIVCLIETASVRTSIEATETYVSLLLGKATPEDCTRAQHVNAIMQEVTGKALRILQESPRALILN